MNPTMIPYNVTSRISLTPRVCRNKMDADSVSGGVFFQLIYVSNKKSTLFRENRGLYYPVMYALSKNIAQDPCKQSVLRGRPVFFRSSCVISSGYIVSHRYRLAFSGHGGKWFLQASFAGQTWKAGLSIWRECSKPWLVVCYTGCDEILPDYIYMGIII